MKLNQQEQAIIEKITQLKTSSSSLLDVGGGAGAVIKYCKSELKLTVAAIDQHQETVAQLNLEGIAAEVADARQLPFSDGAFDLVLISNVLHHIPNADKALSECIRVAKYYVIASELWYDTTIKCQALSAEIEAWNTKLHQALGFYHRTYLNAGEIIALIKENPITDLEINYGLKLIKKTFNYWLDPQKKHMDQLPNSHVFHWELANLKLKMQAQLLCEPGWVIITLKK